MYIYSDTFNVHNICKDVCNTDLQAVGDVYLRRSRTFELVFRKILESCDYVSSI